MSKEEYKNTYNNNNPTKTTIKSFGSLRYIEEYLVCYNKADIVSNRLTELERQKEKSILEETIEISDDEGTRKTFSLQDQEFLYIEQRHKIADIHHDITHFSEKKKKNFII